MDVMLGEETLEDIRKHVEIRGHNGHYLVKFADIWKHVDTFGEIWRNLDTFGNI